MCGEGGAEGDGGGGVDGDGGGIPGSGGGFGGDGVVSCVVVVALVVTAFVRVVDEIVLGVLELSV